MDKDWKIQSIIFNREYYPNKKVVKMWIDKNGFLLMKNKKEPIQKFDNTYRVRQRNPNQFNKFKTVMLKKNKIKVIYGLKK